MTNRMDWNILKPLGNFELSKLTLSHEGMKDMFILQWWGIMD